MSYTSEHSWQNWSIETNPELIVAEKKGKQEPLPHTTDENASIDPLLGSTPEKILYARMGLAMAPPADQTSLEVLFSDLFASHWTTRLRAVQGLAMVYQNAPGRIKRALTRALSDESAYVRAAAARALAQWKDHAPKTDLLLALGDEDWQVRAAVVMALGRLGPYTPVDTLQRRLNSNEEPEPMVRLAALHALSDLNDAHSLPALLLGLQDEDARLRLAAVQFWGQQSEALPMQALLLMLKDEEKEVRQEALKIISQKSELLPLDLLITIIQNAQEDTETRLTALQLLREYKKLLPLEPLLLALKDRNKLIRQAASSILGEYEASIPRQVSPAFLLQLLQDEVEDLRALAAWALGEQQNEDTRAALEQACSDASELVRTAAAQGLQRLNEVSREQQETNSVVSSANSADEVSASARLPGDIGTHFLASLANYLQDRQGIIEQELQRTSDGQVLIFFCRFQSNENRLQETVVKPLARSTQVESVEKALQSEDEVIRFVTSEMMKHLKGKRWNELFITCLELFQDTRIQMNAEVPTKIVFCSVGLPAGSKKQREQVPVLREILTTFQKESICKYAYEVCAPTPGEAETERLPGGEAYLFTSTDTIRREVNPSWLGRALKNIRVWYGAPRKHTTRFSLFFF